MIVKPSIGRILWFYRSGSRLHEQPLSAIVTAVWGDRCVNLAIFESNGVPMSHPPTSVQLVQEGDKVPVDCDGKMHQHCVWMPYQTAQARKHAAEEAADKASIAAN